ncbi:type II toxin-antitoxin system HipA family toxin [Alcaligenaceae bacterium B3P038]|nr:type II toxin-antitoxin system HipA family toxin [Alcaligenaceae bacterium B3P038]
MTDTSKPIWIWLENHTTPVRAGTFTLENNQGRFTYERDYVARTEAFAIDPSHLPLPRATRGAIAQPRAMFTTLHDGLFGALRDVCPEGYGRDLLNLKFQRTDNVLTPMELLEHSAGDGVGAVEVCDDLSRKLAYTPPESQQLIEAIAQLEPERASSSAVHRLLDLGTSMGGERPKLTVIHRDRWWLAKMQDRGDAPHVPAREYVAMTLADECGITTAQTDFVKIGERELLLVRRFDRQGNLSQTMRYAYLSANTVLGLGKHALPGDRSRSYLALADRARRMRVNAKDVREIWQRMVFNMLVNNTDDHPRNHGFLRIGGEWTMAPAFDITPLTGTIGVLAMAVDARGNRQGDALALLQSAPHFGWEGEAAARWLQASAEHIAHHWRRRMLGAGVSASFCDARQRVSFSFAEHVAANPVA